MAIKNAGSENFFYSIRSPEFELNFEELFQDADNLLASVLEKIITSGSMSTLTQTERSVLLGLTALQLTRTRATLNNFESMHNKIKSLSDKVSKEWNIPLENFNPKVTEYDEETAKVIFIQMEGIVEEFANILSQKIARLCHTSDANPFWISDNPVVQNNVSHFGDRGLSSMGTEVAFPISKNYLIVFTCKSTIYSKLIEHIPAEQTNESIDSFLEYLNFTDVHESSPDNVIYYNSLQVREASRFIYSNKNAFVMAKDFTKDYRHNLISKTDYLVFDQSHRIDYPGHSSGTFLVCDGERGHYVLEVNIISLDDLEFRVVKEKDLKALLLEKRIVDFKLVESGKIKLLYHEMKVRLHDNDESRIRAEFLSPILEEIVRKFGKGITGNK